MTRRKDPITGLTSNQEAFCHAFIKCGIGSEAYRKAYPTSLKWKRHSVDVQASKMLGIPAIILRIGHLRKRATDAAVLKEADFLKEVAALAMSRISDIFTPNGNVLPVHKWPDRALAAVASIKFRGMREGTSNGGPGDDLDDDPSETVVLFTQEVKFWPKNPALDMIFKHLGTYERDNAQKNDGVMDMLVSMAPGDLEQLIEKLREIAARTTGPGLGGHDDAGPGKPITH